MAPTRHGRALPMPFARARLFTPWLGPWLRPLCALALAGALLALTPLVLPAAPAAAEEPWERATDQAIPSLKDSPSWVSFFRVGGV